MKPQWLKIRPPSTPKYGEIKDILKEQGLVTVCQEAHCPNMAECWSGGTATFMIMGDTCTRACKFCNVKTAYPAKPLDNDEPGKIADTVTKWKLKYVVITSVDRDDLKDQGSKHFGECVRVMKQKNPDVMVEVLIPDFKGDVDCLRRIVDQNPDVIGHNIETVESLQKAVRDPRAGYEQSLGILKNVKKLNPKIYTKSSIILGFGEKNEEVLDALKDLKERDVDIVTFGQYLRPSDKNIEIKEYVSPDKFKYFKKKAESMGFLYVASAPFVRSSYRAGELFMEGVKEVNK